MTIKGQGYSLILVQVTQIQYFQTFFSLETAGSTEAKFYVQTSWDRCSNDPDHMTKMAAMPIYGKNLKKSSFLNQKDDDLETWYAASGTQVLPNLFK